MYIKPQAEMLKSMAISIALAAMLSACSGPIVMRTNAIDCPRMIPETLRKKTPSAAGPEDSSTKAWIGFGVRQTGQLDVANDRGDAIVSISDECYAQNMKILEESRRRTTPWYKKIF